MNFIAPRYSFQRPNDGTAYGGTDAVANSTSAASVTPLSWSLERVNGGGRVVAVSLFTDDETVTNANFTLYLFRSLPTVAAGDNASFSIATIRGCIGTVSLDLTSGATVTSTDKFKRVALSTPIVAECSTIYGLLATAAAYDPDNDELFEITLEIEG